jgi:hypothetical protein
MTPAPSPADTTGWTQVTSTRFGLSYQMPPAWTVELADPWFGSGGAWGPGEVSNSSERLDPSFGVSSQPLAGPADDPAWWSTYLSIGAACRPGAKAAFSTTTVGGLAAYEWNQLQQCGLALVVVFDRGRAYVLGMRYPNPEGDYGGQYPADNGLLFGLLSTVHFDPTGAMGSSPGPTASMH